MSFDWSERPMLEVAPDVKFYATRPWRFDDFDWLLACRVAGRLGPADWTVGCFRVSGELAGEKSDRQLTGM